ncbi:hypothetical protein AAFF_G00056520 [Aldrovandia affinis]|uniref:Uncharacterized protein n=1 Tax=Aldrovandia affinis TaxID=143900 RepID=A0AAD7VX54_9TELE|nr:hypothetical protein AAFF_G00056520 [Aldrovandia affinis]
MSVQDLSHRQTPQRTLPVEVTHHSWRAASTHPVPPDSSGHPRGSHHLATGQPRVQGPVVQSLCTRDRGRALAKESRHCLVSRDLTSAGAPHASAPPSA